VRRLWEAIELVETMRLSTEWTAFVVELIDDWTGGASDLIVAARACGLINSKR
jgi:hypothetical protein